jgi:hypothetical protein
VEISLIERELVAVSKATHAQLRSSSAAWRLIDRGVISLTSTKQVPFGVRAGPYVGSCLLEDRTRVVVREKTAGAVQHLLEWCVAKDARTLASASRGLHDQHAPWILAARYVDAVGRYLSAGRVKEYFQPLEISNRVSGRLNLPGTIRLRARGRVSVVACHPPSLSGDVLVNRIAHAALLACEQLVEGSPLRATLRSSIQAYARLLQPSTFTNALLAAPRDMAAALKGSSLKHSSNHVVAQMLELARAILLDLGFFGEVVGADIGESCFVSLEGLYERAVCGILGSTGFGVRGKSLGNPVFTDRLGAEPVDPDFVLVSQTGRPFVVGDCKFKQSPSNPATDDVYQVLTHARSCVCSTAVLVYPGEERVVSRFGRTVEGTELFIATVRLHNLDRDLRQMVEFFSREWLGPAGS